MCIKNNQFEQTQKEIIDKILLRDNKHHIYIHYQLFSSLLSRAVKLHAWLDLIFPEPSGPEKKHISSLCSFDVLN